MTRRERRDPWTHAVAAGRPDYITPEDITDAIASGAGRLEIYQTTLEAIQQRKAEDPRLCAFVAVHSGQWRTKATPKRSTE